MLKLRKGRHYIRKNEEIVMEVVVAGNLHLPNYAKKEKKGSRPYLTYYFMWKKHQNHYNKRHHCKMSYVLADCGKQTDFKDIF